MEKHMKLFKESVELLEKISVTKEDDDPDRNILTEVCKKVDDVHCELRHQISSSATDASFLIFQDSKSKVMKELNEVCDKLSDLSIKDDVQKYIDSLQDDDNYSCDDDSVDVDVDDDTDDDDDDDSDDGAMDFYLESKKILTREVEHLDQTLQFINELVETADKARVSECDHDHLLLSRAYHMIQFVLSDLSHTSDAALSSSVWDGDLTSMICKSRSQVENLLNSICSNVFNLTIKGDCSQHLNGFKEACLRLPKLPSRILDSSLDYTAGKRMSSQSEMTITEKKSKSCSGEAESEGSGGCKSPIDLPENPEAEDELYDVDYYYHYHNKCMEEEDEQYYPRVIRIGNWDPEYEGHGISLLDRSALRDYSKDELDLSNMSEGSPNFHLEVELNLTNTSKGIHLEDELDLANMSEGSPKVHPEDELDHA